MKILSFGEIIWDIHNENKTLGGAPLNFATYSAILGNSVWLASAVGDDILGKSAFTQISNFNINTEFISTSINKPTGQCLISLDQNKVPCYNLLENTAYDYISLPNKLPYEYDILSFGTLALRKENNLNTLKTILNTNSFNDIYVDLNIRPPFFNKENIDFCLTNATILKVSDEELPIACQTLFNSSFEHDDAIKAISKNYPQIKIILLTCGANGAYCYEAKTNQKIFCPAEKTTVVSTVGAGDSFGSTFLTFYKKTNDIFLSLKLSSKVSAFVVTHEQAVPSGVKDFIKTLL